MMAPRVNHRDRWLLPYADFVTLLFAVFVMMYAMEKSRASHRFLPVPVSPPVAATASVPVQRPTLMDDLRSKLKAEEQEGFLSLSSEPRGLVITLNDKTLFRAGEARIQPSAESSFEKVGSVLARYPNHMLLEGHTDSVPIHNERFRSNWELSTARSIAVMELLELQSDIPPDRFSIGGSADNTPLSTDGTERGRSRNRRVEIVVLENSSRY